MSKSRLEKFLYALYSLDSSDLPNPLSRIEELYKCLVTGDEAPTFEPLSRVEKYLMAILGVYDVDSLPNPISRVEVLLYKLATGDDSLEDFDTFLSEHEELLAGIIGNGGVGGNIDIEYVLYTLSTEFNTLYNTAEKPVKSAILKGNTLVNLATPIEYKNIMYHGYCLVFNGSMLKSGKYTLKSSVDFSQYVINLLSTQKDNPSQYRRITISKNGVFTIDDTFFVANTIKVEDFFICLRPIDDTESGTVTTNEIENCEVILLEGDHANEDIPYFTGMQSVKMPVLTTMGKNLYSGYEVGLLNTGTGIVDTTAIYACTTNFINIKGREQLKTKLPSRCVVLFYDANKELVQTGWHEYHNANPTIRIPNEYDLHYMRIKIRPGLETEAFKEMTDVMVVDVSEDINSYEPYKSNILTVNEEVELHEIGDIKDELNLLTGEVVKRVGKVVLDGSIDESWTTITKSNAPAAYVEGYASAYIYLSDFRVGTSVKLINDRGLPRLSYVNSISEGLFYLNNYIGNRALILRIDKSKVTNSLREYLQHNPITIQYQLATESVKTVDLSVVDQDGNDTKLKTFNDITHVTLSSEGLIPEAELEVATKNEEVLNTLSLEMDDISTAQTTLEETSNTQSENVDATMIATTEIYEQLL